MAPRDLGRRARKEFVPGAAARERPLDHGLEVRVVHRLKRTVRCIRHELAQRLARSALATFLERRVALERCRERQQCTALRLARTRGGRAYEGGAFAKGERDVVALSAAHELVAPGREGVDPCRDGVAMGAESRRHETRLPYVVAERSHGNGDPARASGGRMQERAGDALVALGDDVRFDLDGVAEHAFQRRSAAIDDWTDLLDECPATAVDWQFHVEFGGKMATARLSKFCAALAPAPRYRTALSQRASRERR